MVFTRNKLDKPDETLLNKLVEFGGDITYSNGFYIWNKGMAFWSVCEMEEYMRSKI